VFLHHARLALSQIETAGEAARRAEQPDKPVFVIGFLSGQEVAWLPAAPRILRQESPDTEISISSHSSPELAAGLMQRKVDVAILRREKETTGLVFKFLIKEPLITLMPATHRLTARKAVRPQDLAREIFVGPAQLAPVPQVGDQGLCGEGRYHAATEIRRRRHLRRNVVAGIHRRCDAASALRAKYADPIGCRSAIAGRATDHRSGYGLQQVEHVSTTQAICVPCG
jgi:DNA-binding transcriptional LysR family regulator